MPVVTIGDLKKAEQERVRSFLSKSKPPLPRAFKDDLEKHFFQNWSIDKYALQKFAKKHNCKIDQVKRKFYYIRGKALKKVDTATQTDDTESEFTESSSDEQYYCDSSSSGSTSFPKLTPDDELMLALVDFEYGPKSLRIVRDGDLVSVFMKSKKQGLVGALQSKVIRTISKGLDVDVPED